jgi:uncharacterized protein (DUF362 family)
MRLRGPGNTLHGEYSRKVAQIQPGLVAGYCEALMSDGGNASRRDFLKTCVVGAVALSASDLAIAKKAVPTAAMDKSKVVIARDEMLNGAGTSPDSARVGKLLDRAMQSFFGARDPVTPWKKSVHPGEVVGLKVNTIAGPGLSTNRVLIEAICERLKQAGVEPGNIVVWDRWNRELERTGYDVSNDSNRERFLGTDSKEFGYEEEPASFGSVTTHLSKLLTRACDCMINVPLLKDHEIAGVTGAMKNMYGVVDKPFLLHGNNGSPYIADLYAIPAIKDKCRFAICDAFTGAYNGGPMFSPQFTWKYNGLIVARDPVAMDYTLWQTIERKRTEMGLKSLEEVGRPPKHIAIAADAQHRLGTNDPKRIALIEA